MPLPLCVTYAEADIVIADNYRQELTTSRQNAEVVASLQTSCYKSVHKLSTSCVRTAWSQLL